MRPLRRAAAGAAVLAVAFAMVSATPVSATSDTPAPRRYVTGWLPYWSPGTALSSVSAHASVFSDASPFWFTTPSAGVVQSEGSASTLVAMTASLHASGVTVIPTVTASMTADTFAKLLASPAKRSSEVAALVKVASRYHADGLDLDFESINSGSGAARAVVLAKFPLFTQALHDALAGDGRLLSLTLPARTSDADPNWAVYDYAALGASADRVRIMTYDYHWGGGSAGPIAPRSWVREVLAYAVTRITASKISFGLPAYGRDWYLRTVSGKCPASARSSLSRTTADMQTFARSRGVTPSWSARDTSRTFTYVQKYAFGGRSCRAKRVAWYDDARSIHAKTGLVKRFQLRGVAVWALGYEAPGAWSPLTRFAVRNPVQSARLTQSATASLAYGHTGLIRGTLRTGSKPVAGATVRLQRRAPGGPWTTVRRVTTNRRGQVDLLVRPASPVSFRLLSPRAWSRKAATAAAAHVGVRYAVGVVAPTGRFAALTGARIGLRGKVSPASAQMKVVLQHWTGSRWVVRDVASTRADGSFAFTTKFANSGRHELRYVVPSGALDRGASRSFVVHVR